MTAPEDDPADDITEAEFWEGLARSQDAPAWTAADLELIEEHGGEG